MYCHRTKLKGLLVIEAEKFSDDRGEFLIAYHQHEFVAAGVATKFIQDNQSLSRKGVIRALHTQLEPCAQTKLVRVITGRIIDICVDIRPGSATYGEYERFDLSANDQLQIFIPPGFLHGFSVLEEATTVSLKIDNCHNPNHVVGVRWNDPCLNIDWGLTGEPILSAADRKLPYFKDLKIGL